MVATEARKWNLANVGEAMNDPDKGVLQVRRSERRRKEMKMREPLEETGIPALLREVVEAGLVPGGDAKIVWDYTYGGSDPEYVGISLYFGKGKDEHGTTYRKVSLGVYNDTLTIDGEETFEVNLGHKKEIEKILGLAIAKPGFEREMVGKVD